MKKGRSAAALLLCLLLLALPMLGCDGKEYELHFKNQTGATLDNVYFSAVEKDSWGDPVTKDRLSDGSTIGFDFERLGGVPGVYDVGAIAGDGLCYDVYDVPLAVGDTLILGPKTTIDGIESTTLTVTHADGTSDTYLGYCYFESDLDDINGAA